MSKPPQDVRNNREPSKEVPIYQPRSRDPSYEQQGHEQGYSRYPPQYVQPPYYEIRDQFPQPHYYQDHVQKPIQYEVYPYPPPTTQYQYIPPTPIYNQPIQPQLFDQPIYQGQRYDPYPPQDSRFDSHRSGPEKERLPDPGNLHVSGLTEKVTVDTLKEIFGKFGRLKSVRLPKDIYTEKHRGYAFVTFEDIADARKAIRDPIQLDGRDLKMDFAKEGPKKRDPRSGDPIRHDRYPSEYPPPIERGYYREERRGYSNYDDRRDPRDPPPMYQRYRDEDSRDSRIYRNPRRDRSPERIIDRGNEIVSLQKIPEDKK